MSYSFRQDLPRLVKAMERAPSLFDQQLWKLRLVADDRVELYYEPDPVLGKLLPREVVISCGAALYNLRLAIQVAGREPVTWLLPNLNVDPGLLSRVTAERTLLASVEVTPGRPARPTIAQQERYEALWLRRTDRWPDGLMRVPPPILVEMENAAARERGWLRVLSRSQGRQVLRAVKRASEDPLLSSLSSFRAMPLAADLRHAQLMSLDTDDDRPLDWLRAGEALQRAVLNGTRFSMSALGGRSTPYRQQLEYGPLDPHRLRPRRPVPAGYVVEVTFLTQALELADLKAQLASREAADGEDGGGLELADLEALATRDPKDRQRREDGGLRWPWRTYFTEIPQVVMRVGWAPAERDDGLAGLRVFPAPRPSGENQPSVPASAPRRAPRPAES